jgi:hypothetical protein
MLVPSATWIFDGSEQPGRPLQPWNDEFAFGRVSSLTTVPAGKKAEQVPEPLPKVIVQLIPAGCDVIVPLPLPPGTMEMLPFEKWKAFQTVMIPYLAVVESPPTVPMIRAD